jgi:hypothetical protein
VYVVFPAFLRLCLFRFDLCFVHFLLGTSIPDSTNTDFHVLTAAIALLRRSLPHRPIDAHIKQPVFPLTPRQALAAVHAVRITNVFPELLLLASTKASAETDRRVQVKLQIQYLQTDLKQFIDMFGQLAIDVALVAMHCCDFEWLQVLRAVTTLVEHSIRQLKRLLTMPFMTAVRLSGTGCRSRSIPAVSSDALLHDYTEHVTDAMMHGLMVFVTGVEWDSQADHVSHHPVDAPIPTDIRFCPLFVLYSRRVVYVRKGACPLHHAVMAVKLLEDLAIVSSVN